MEYVPRILMRHPLTTDFLFMLFMSITLLYVPIERILEMIVLPEICSSDTCVEEATLIKLRMNQNKNPCENFYNFACGGHKNVYNPTFILHENIKKQMIEIYQPPYIYQDHPMLNIERRLYALCEEDVGPRVDKTMFDKNYETIKQTIHMLGEWPVLEGSNWRENKFNWVEATYVLKLLGYNHEIFFNLSVVPDPTNSERHIFKVSTKPVRYPRIEDMKKYATLLGANMKIMVNAVEEMYQTIGTLLLQLENLYPLSKDSDELLSISSIQHRQATEFNWLDFINRILHPVARLEECDFILVSNPKKVVSLIDNLSKIPKRPLSNFMIWIALEEIHSALESPSCFQKMQEIFQNYPNPLDVIYLKNHFSLDTSEEIKTMINYIERVILKMIKQSTRLKNKDKKTIKKLVKQSTTDMIIGAPEEYFDANILNEWILDLEETHGQTFLNILSTNRYLKMFLFVQKLKRHFLYKKFFKSISQAQLSHWNLHDATTEVLEYYHEEKIVLPATILQNYLYNSKRPDFLNYGSLGSFIAADLIHKFTDLLLYDDGWSNKTIKTVLKFRNCLLQQMKDYLNVTGIEEQWDHKLLLQVLSTNISYSAYKEWENDDGKERRLWSMKYTNDQLFWIAAASYYCNLPIPIELDATTSILLSEKMRDFYIAAIGINNDNFARDFKCDSKSMMNPIQKCPIF